MQQRERLEVGQTITALDLAQALEGQEGEFICQQGGQTYVVATRQGHSITAGPIPVGRRSIEVGTNSQEWTIQRKPNLGTTEAGQQRYEDQQSRTANR